MDPTQCWLRHLLRSVVQRAAAYAVLFGVVGTACEHHVLFLFYLERSTYRFNGKVQNAKNDWCSALVRNWHCLLAPPSSRCSSGKKRTQSHLSLFVALSVPCYFSIFFAVGYAYLHYVILPYAVTVSTYVQKIPSSKIIGGRSLWNIWSHSAVTYPFYAYQEG